MVRFVLPIATNRLGSRAQGSLSDRMEEDNLNGERDSEWPVEGWLTLARVVPAFYKNRRVCARSHTHCPYSFHWRANKGLFSWGDKRVSEVTSRLGLYLVRKATKCSMCCTIKTRVHDMKRFFSEFRKQLFIPKARTVDIMPYRWLRPEAVRHKFLISTKIICRIFITNCGTSTPRKWSVLITQSWDNREFIGWVQMIT